MKILVDAIELDEHGDFVFNLSARASKDDWIRARGC